MTPAWACMTAVCGCVVLADTAGPAVAAAQQRTTDSLPLATCRAPNLPVDLRCGTFWVNEDRSARGGRRIPLYVRIIPSEAEHAAPDPLVFVSAGGPGVTNSDLVPYAYGRGWRAERDVVLVDLRGTSGPDRLDCPPPPTLVGLLLVSQLDTVAVARCRALLESRADLRQYTTRNVVDDLHDALVALGYTHVNLWGASGGTREVLEFIRHHGDMVRAAIVEGTAPVSFKNPLPLAQAAQEGLDSLFAQCERDATCRAAFPHFWDEFEALRTSLRDHPAVARVPPALGDPDSTAPVTWSTFVEVIREMSYTAIGGRVVPLLVHRAATGDFGSVLNSGVNVRRRTRAAVRLGFLLSQTCTEDVPRITDAEVASQTEGTYLGDVRVRDQRAACAGWPRGTIAPEDLTPVRSDVPVLLLAGTIDPVTRPQFAQDAARTLPNSLVVIAPGGHVPAGSCVEAMERQFLSRAMPRDVDTSCVREMTLPPFNTGRGGS